MKSGLIVDDHSLFRQVLAVTLKHRTDFKENVQAGSLAEARQVLADRDGKVDLELPKGDATELIHKLYELDIPVLAFRVWKGALGRCKREQTRLLVWPPPTRTLSAK
jgi:DNA-binding NarL/FixJ family response regulator